ncbi:MAG: ATP-binding protein, partial [Cyanobacteriota bacterium SKYGB_h_bin112]|nr:ATP-binding protein [Cyanobacteriota bacterium SKYGB_h_bin112]
MIHQFTHQFEPSALRYWVDEKEARAAILGKVTDKGQRLDYQDYRLGFRKIARNTDIRTLISTIIPPNFCSENFQVALSFDEQGKRLIEYDEMLFLCALFNSFCVDSVLRQRVSANVNFFYVYQLSIPRLEAGDRWFTEIVERAAKLICTTPEFDDLWRAVFPEPPASSPLVAEGFRARGVTDEAERAKLRAELDGIIAHIYGLT